MRSHRRRSDQPARQRALPRDSPRRRRIRSISICICLVGFVTFFAAGLRAQSLGELARPTSSEELDYLIVGARLYDGTGSPWIHAAVGISGDRIDYVGPEATAPAAETRISGVSSPDEK